MICYQREAGDYVPGCEGGEEAMSKTDYCVYPGDVEDYQGQQGQDRTFGNGRSSSNSNTIPTEKNVDKVYDENYSAGPSISHYKSSSFLIGLGIFMAATAMIA